MNDPPFVIWLGRNPLAKGAARLFRLVYRGPARPERPDDVPFGLEQKLGHDFMKRYAWGAPRREDALQEALWAMAYAFGQILVVDPKRLHLEHPLHCEMNMAVIEGRNCKGCDCNSPPDPLGAAT